MAYLVNELRAEAESAMARMREAALAAREAHARAELLRHMLWTAGMMKQHPRATAIAKIVDEWLAAWALDRNWPHVAEMEALSSAFLDHAVAPSEATDRAIRAVFDRLERVFAGAGLPVADQMAWRSGCAHGWWAEVKPAPAGKGRTDRAWPKQPFWAEGCPPHCLGPQA
jgi:hypothetical protein